ncbi:ATP-binding cassette domain-containing protein [Amycolatopsis sp. lyj-109]|uniref:ATP-binding cassette domain-containing protein n=1 Tax=Amycolatopsis sp. lyj-109 TaxID=2789287 RepID=UPI00397A377A
MTVHELEFSLLDRRWRLAPGERFRLGGTGSDGVTISELGILPLAEVLYQGQWLIRVLLPDVQVTATGAIVDANRYVYLGDVPTSGVVRFATHGTQIVLEVHGKATPEVHTVQSVASLPARPGQFSVAAEAGYQIRDRLIFGTDEGDGRVVVRGDGVAPEHAVLSPIRDKFRLLDHGHGDGTFVNGHAILWAMLRSGDRFTIGEEEFKVDGGSVTRLTPRIPGLVVDGVSARNGAGGQAIRNVGFTAESGHVTAIIGPSGSGKSSLLRTLLDRRLITHGSVRFRDLDLVTRGSEFRHLLGYVPQDDHLYLSLTARQTLTFTARLRLPRGLTADQRGKKIGELAASLGIVGVLDKPLHSLSGGERKRVSLAVELLAGPLLLLLDEPTSALDPGWEAAIFDQLGAIAGEGRTVLVVTHSTNALEQVDRVVALGSGGRLCFDGRPQAILTATGSKNSPELMNKLADPAALAPAPSLPDARPQPHVSNSETPTLQPRRHRPSLGQQIRLLMYRQQLLLHARGFIGLLQLLVVPLGGAVLAAAVSNSAGLYTAQTENLEAISVCSLLITVAMLTGQALTYNDIVPTVDILRRDFLAGVAPAAVILSKLLFFGIISLLQSVILVGGYLVFRPGLDISLTGLPPFVELWLAVAATAAAAMVLGLVISAAAVKIEQSVGWATATAVLAVALNGATFSLPGMDALNVISMILPTRWGLAALASSIKLPPASPAREWLWSSTPSHLLLDVGSLAVLMVVYSMAATLFLSKRISQ